ncbi:MAG: FxsA family protein [Thermoanaerobaculia bacterium]
MFFRLLLLFTAVPLVELALLFEIGKFVGLPATIALVLGTGILGAWLAKREGLRALTRVREEMASGRLPAEALLDGLLILIAGAVLLTPGLLTDVAGFVLLIPASRHAIRRRVAARLRRGLETEDPRVVIIDDRPR